VTIYFFKIEGGGGIVEKEKKFILTLKVGRVEEFHVREVLLDRFARPYSVLSSFVF
jgi:hypothetical protein